MSGNGNGTHDMVEFRYKRHEIFNWICQYADERNGITPSYMEIARQFCLSRGTVRNHVLLLALDGLLRLEDRQIIVEDSDWIPPPHYVR
jgi:DNA-binding GntR family transcriptional regulator